jgi:hypothetical protein
VLKRLLAKEGKVCILDFGPIGGKTRGEVFAVRLTKKNTQVVAISCQASGVGHEETSVRPKELNTDPET